MFTLVHEEIRIYVLLSLENEFAKGLQRLYQSSKHSITHVRRIYFTLSVKIEK